MSAASDVPSGSMTDRGAYTYIAVFSAALYTVLLIAPVVAGKLAQQFHLTSTQVGLVFSFELGVVSLATVPAYLWLHRVNLRTASYMAAGLVVAGNVMSGLVASYPLLVALRFLTALAAGSITAETLPDATSDTRQAVLFSATMPHRIEDLARN